MSDLLMQPSIIVASFVRTLLQILMELTNITFLPLGRSRSGTWPKRGQRRKVWRSIPRLVSSRAIRLLGVVDTFTRECLALEVDTSFASRRVTRVPDAVIAERGRLRRLLVDNGSELTSRHFLSWGTEWKLELAYIQPGKPVQNAHVESLF
jgi:transposase InsO family protein